MYLSSSTTLLTLLLPTATTTLAAPMTFPSPLSPRSQSVTISTPLDGASPVSLLSLVHDPTYMINANGLVTSQTQISTSPVTFEISDDLIKLPFALPFGLANPFKTTYTATFENTATGLVTRSDAGGGALKLTGTWTVDGDAGVLREDVLLEGNSLAILVARPFVQSAHGKMHGKLIADAKAAGA